MQYLPYDSFPTKTVRVVSTILISFFYLEIAFTPEHDILNFDPHGLNSSSSIDDLLCLYY